MDSLSPPIPLKLASSPPRNRILFISPQPFFSTRGTPINVRAMAEILTAGGYQVTVLTLPYGEDLPGMNIKRVWKIPFVKAPPIGPSLTKVFYGTLLLSSAFKIANEVDLIHGFEEGAMIGGLTGLLKSTPYIADVDSCMVTQLQNSGYRMLLCNRLFAAIENFFLRRAKAAITVCEALTRSTAAKAPLLRLFQIEDFPLEESLVVSSAKYEELKGRFPGKRILLYTGNLESYQGTDLMIRAYAKYLSSNKSGTLLLIVGGTPDGVSRLKALSVECGIESQVVFEGPRPPSEMGAYMAAADFFLSPRDAGENVPLKLYTYLAACKPLIATNILSHTQILSEESAFLGEPTIEGFTAAMTDALASSDAKKRAQAGLALVQSKYSREDFKRRLLEAYQEILPIGAQTAAAVSARHQTRYQSR